MEQKTITISLRKVFKWLSLIVLLGGIVFVGLASQSGYGGQSFYAIVSFVHTILRATFPLVTLVLVILFGWQVVRYLGGKSPEEKHGQRSSIVKILITALIWLVLFGFINVISDSFGVGVGDDVGMQDIATVDFDGGSNRTLANPMRQSFGSNWFNQNENGSIADTREFMKVSYSGNIKTRDVKDTARDVRGIIRDMEGRVDSENVNEKYGYIKFVIPKSNFDDFRDEIESITHKKLYTENTSSQNLLSQKQNIEEQSGQATMTLGQLQQSQADLTKKHNQTTANLKSELVSVQKKITNIRNIFSTYIPPESGDTSYINELTAQLTIYLNEESQIKQKISTENTNYQSQNKSLTDQIANTNNTIKDINTQDKNFTANVETVNGSINIQWVNLWQLAQIFSPIPPIFIIVFLLLIIWYVLRKMNRVPMFILKW